MKQNLVVVGGGTAGWLTALLLKRSLQCDVTVIASSEIGTIGVGEGTTPQFLDAMAYLGISLEKLVSETGCTLKSGIKFTNWNNDGTSYFHQFAPAPSLSHENYTNFSWVESDTNISLLAALGQYGFADKAHMNWLLAEDGKIAITPTDDMVNVSLWSAFGVHFDANQISKLLQDTAVERGVHHIDGDVVSTVLDDNNYITGIVLNDGRVLESDFVFDCSGFARVVINTLQNTWVPCSHRLPANTAVAFRTSSTDVLPSYTTATAMRNGWLWNIPLQHTTGNGYVFSSEFTSVEAVVSELRDSGISIDNYRVINFDTGYLSEPWVNNCVAIGLASGFVEPLEATSIWTTITSVARLTVSQTPLRDAGPKTRDYYNLKCVRHYESIIDFIELHYYTNRNDTPFWKSRSLSPHTLNLLELWSERVPAYEDVVSPTTSMESQLIVAVGNGVLSPHVFEKELDHHPRRSDIMDTLSTMRTDYRLMSSDSYYHRQLIELMKERALWHTMPL